MKTIRELEDDLENAHGGQNTGDIEAAVIALEEAKCRELREAAECGWVWELRHGCYSTGCNNEVRIAEPAITLEDVSWVYCPHCGGKIIEESNE